MSEETDIELNKNKVSEIIAYVLDKGSTYVIKAMPVNSSIQSMLMQLKEDIFSSEFLSIIKTAVSSSIIDGLQNSEDKDIDLSNLNDLVTTAFEGGLTNVINMSLDIVNTAKEYGNIFYNYIDNFFSDLKDYVSSIDFKNKIFSAIEKILQKIDDFKELCNDWYDAYEADNIDEVKSIAKKINKLKEELAFDTNCINENNIIQNLVSLAKEEKMEEICI